MRESFFAKNNFISTFCEMKCIADLPATLASGDAWVLQGYLTYKKTHFPRTLP